MNITLDDVLKNYNACGLELVIYSSQTLLNLLSEAIRANDKRKEAIIRREIIKRMDE